MNAISVHLNRSELAKLEGCEGKIARGLHTFVEVGAALLTVREGKLYREKFDTFEEYCAVRWNMTARRARQICAASEVVGNLLDPEVLSKGKPIFAAKGVPPPPRPSPPGQGAVGASLVLPASESQARPLSHLKPAEQREAWGEVLAEAPEGRVTAGLVERVAQKFLGVKAPKGNGEKGNEKAKLRPPSGEVERQGEGVSDRGQRIEDRGQRSAALGEGVSDRGQRIEDRGQRSAALPPAFPFHRDSRPSETKRSRVELILEAVRGAIKAVNGIKELLYPGDSVGRAECWAALTRLDSLEQRFKRKRDRL